MIDEIAENKIFKSKILQDKPTFYSTAQLLPDSSGARAKNLVKFYKTSVLATAKLILELNSIRTYIFSYFIPIYFKLI